MVKKPTHRLRMKERDGTRTNEVGAGWLNEGGSVTIVLNLGVVISFRDKDDFILTLFPEGERT